VGGGVQEGEGREGVGEGAEPEPRTGRDRQRARRVAVAEAALVNDLALVGQPDRRAGDLAALDQLLGERLEAPLPAGHRTPPAAERIKPLHTRRKVPMVSIVSIPTAGSPRTR